MEEQKLTIALHGVDPKRVPKRKLYTGAEIPAIGLGTFGSDRFSEGRNCRSCKGGYFFIISISEAKI